jgi:hypothetical protein
MHTYDIGNVIVRLYEQIRSSNQVYSEEDERYFPENDFIKSGNNGILVTVHAHCDNFGYEKDGNTHHPEWVRGYSMYVHIILTVNYNVFVATSNNRDPYAVPLEEWSNPTNHDSVWREAIKDAILAQVRKGAEFCFAHMPDKHLPYRPGDEVHLTLERSWSSLFDIVTVGHEACGTHYHRRILKSIDRQEIEFKIKTPAVAKA